MTRSIARDICKEAILINTKPVKANDYLHAFLTDCGIERIMEYNGRKRGTVAFKLFSQGKVFLYKREGDAFASLLDSKPDKIRKGLLGSDSFLSLSPFLAVISFFSHGEVDGLFRLVQEAFDLLDVNVNSKRVFVSFAEGVFAGLGFVSDFFVCPSCGKHFQDDERLGYDFDMCAPSCQGCSSLFPALLPGMRRYLRLVQGMSLERAAKVEISEKSIERICGYERMRLSRLGVRLKGS